jgi:hypothetical protein
LFLILASLFLIFRAGRLAAAALRGSQEPSEPVSAGQLHAFLVATAGLVILGIVLGKLPWAIHNVAVYFSDFGDKLPAEQRSFKPSTIIWSFGLLFQAGFGVFLVVKGAAFADFLRRRFMARMPEDGGDKA